MGFKSKVIVTMRNWALFFSSLPLTLILFSGSTHASTVNINITVDLNASQIYDCGGGAYPVGTNCWTNNFDSSSSITPQTINRSEDTIIIHMNFAEGQRIRWETDGITVPTYGDESVQVGVSGPGSCCSSMVYDNSLSFTGVTGDLNINPLEWSFASGGSGGIVSQSYQSGVTNLTDSFFEFDGLVATIGPFTNPSSQAYTVDRLSIFLTSGNFSYVNPVPIPSAVWLFGSGLIGLIGVARRKKV